MPIYEYQCESCEHKFETMQRLSEDPLKDCPECGEAALRKLISAAAFVLKGTGWYETDFKDKKKDKTSDGEKKEGEGGKDGEAKSKDGETKKSESKDTKSSDSKKSTESKTTSGSTSSSGSSSSD